MKSIKDEIISCLNQIKGMGAFMTMGRTAFQFPGLVVAGLGEISYPINQLQAKALIDAADRAPFGKGSETVIDTNVRNTWEIDAAGLSFNGKGWDAVLTKILDKVKQDLGLEGAAVSAHLYKLLIYEEGSFFLPHKDTEKEKGMFGSLIIELPSRYTGGELVVRFEDKEETVDFTKAADSNKINYAAFYADCDHEVKPLTSGHRVCLVYNLVQQEPEAHVGATSIETQVERLAHIFAEQRKQSGAKPNIILLGHQYTPENFSKERLKLNDRPRAEALLRAAQQAGCYAKLCLVTSHLIGMPDSLYYGYNDDAR